MKKYIKICIEGFKQPFSLFKNRCLNTVTLKICYLVRGLKSEILAHKSQTRLFLHVIAEIHVSVKTRTLQPRKSECRNKK